MKKLVYLISPNKINKKFYKNLNNVLLYGNVKFFQLRLKKNNILKIANKIKIKDFALYTHQEMCPEIWDKLIQEKNNIMGTVNILENIREINPKILLGSFSPIFWVYFPEARKVLINAEVFNSAKNDAERRTYDDVFWKRMFGSTIVKESAVMDRNVNEYMVGLDALLEAERIKEEIFNIEHDLWEY